MIAPFWTPDEDAELKRLYINDRKGVKEIGSLMGRKVLGVKSRLNLLGIKRKDQSPAWTAEEDAILRECFDKAMSSTTISKLVKRGASAISHRRRALELHSREAGERWTPEQDGILREMVARKTPIPVIAESFGKKRAAVSARMGKLGITLGDEPPKRWTPEEDDLVRTLFYDNRSRSEMAAILKVRYGQLVNRLALLKLRTRKNPSVLSRFTEEQIQNVIQMYVGGIRTPEIAALSGMSEQTMYHIIDSRNVPKRRQPMRINAWTEDERRQMISLLDAGKSVDEIASAMDRGASGIVSAARKLGLRSKYQAFKDYRNEKKRSQIENLDGRLRYILDIAERRAVSLDMDFNLTLEGLKSVFATQNGKCHYSGVPLSVITHDPYLLSIDRVDSTKGYSTDNIVLAAWHVNFMKQDLNADQFLDLCKKVTEHQSLKASLPVPESSAVPELQENATVRIAV